MPPAEPNGGRGERRSWIFTSLGYAVALASLIWVFHGVDFHQVFHDFSRLEWHWVLIAVVTDISVYVVQGWRWSILLSPVKPVPVLRSIRAVYVGIFANEVLPLRSGELIRCYLQARWNSIPFSVVLSSFVIERVFDGIWLSVAFYATTLFIDLPRFLLELGKVLAIAVCIAVAILFYFKFHRAHATAAIDSRRWLAWLRHLLDGLHDMGDSPSFYLSALVSIPYLVLQVLPFYALMMNFNLDLSFWEAFVVLIIVRLGTVLPQAPGNVGTFQGLTVLSLRLFGVDKTTALSLSLLMFGVITLPLLLVGFGALTVTGIRFDELRRHARSSKAGVPDEEMAPNPGPGESAR